jgi:Glycosyltransferase family 10 (fucosyltransferase) C-term
LFTTENAEVIACTTEKYWYAIAAGAVPIVNGAPNSKDWMPPHSAIFTKDFNDNGTAIAEHILAVASNETAYAEYHAWRTDGQYYEPFQRKIVMSERNMACNICIEGAKQRLIDRHVGTYNRSSESYQYFFDMAALDHLRYDKDKGSQIA